MVNNTQQSELGLILLSIQGELRSIGDVQRRLRAVEKSLRERRLPLPLPTQESDLVDIRTACHMLGGISRSTIYRMLSDGRLESVAIGRRRMITRESICQYLPSALTRGSKP